jgi:hypothetical protein
MRIARVWLAAFPSLFAAQGVQAAVLAFNCITLTTPADCAVGEAQFSVEALASGAGVEFTFRNVGVAPAAITDVYFDDGTLLALSAISNGAGVAFSRDAAPGNLPGGAAIDPAFVATQGYTADSDAPVARNGVNPGEVLSIFFTLQAGLTYDDVLRDLGSGALRIGVHAQDYADGGSASFVNVAPVPLPAAFGLLLSGLVGGRLLLRRAR